MSSIWNTRVSVVANLEAVSPNESITLLRESLERAGFIVYDGDEDDAFEAEEGTEIDELPR